MSSRERRPGGEPPAPGEEAAGAAPLSRRALLHGAGGLVVGAAGGLLVGSTLPQNPADPPRPDATAGGGSASRGVPVPAAGEHQAGVARPATPQPHALLAVHDLGDPAAPADLAAVRGALAAMGRRILELADPGRYDDSVTPDGPGDLVVAVGLGPRILTAIDPGLPGAASLPLFRGDERIDAARLGGDLLLSVHATDAAILAPVLDAVDAAADTAAPGLLRRRWTERGFRSPGEGGVARNPLGYLDGIRVPRSEEELADSVWISPDDDPRAAGGTVLVLRRLALDVARFAAEPETRRDEVIGRRRLSGAPLSGGGMHDDVDLTAKTPEGRYLTPARSHARAAHPSFTASGLMLRRPYAFASPGPAGGQDEAGLLFLSFQRELESFTRTQLRLDEVDDLMGYATPTASASFLILPGYDAERPLGSTLLGAG